MVVAVSACAALAAACGDDSSGPTDTANVTVRDFEFDPEAIVVEPGTTVTWTWVGSEEHTIDFDDASLQDSQTQVTGTHVVTMPTTPGTYAYHCAEHPQLMTGSIQVQ